MNLVGEYELSRREYELSRSRFTLGHFSLRSDKDNKVFFA